MPFLDNCREWRCLNGERRANAVETNSPAYQNSQTLGLIAIFAFCATAFYDRLNAREIV